MKIFLYLLGAFALISFITMLFSPAEAWWPDSKDSKYDNG